MGFKFGATFIVLFILLLFVVAAGVDKVGAKSIGVKDRFGKVLGTMQPGMAWTGLFVHVTQYSKAIKKMEVLMLEGEKTSVDIDGQTVRMRVLVNYRINPEKVEYAYSNVCQADNGCLENILNLEGLIREQAKATTSQYTSKYMWQNRQEIKEEAIKKITANFPDVFELSTVMIPDFDFNPDFVAQLEAQKVNEEREIAESKAVKVEEQLAEKKIATAYGDAEKLKMEADAQAYQQKAMAEAQAFEIERIGQAEATALKLKKAQLNDLMVQNNWIDQWDGMLPRTMMGDSNGLLLNVPLE